MGLLLAGLLALAGSATAAELPAGEILTYERHVRPVLKTHCFHCHGEGSERQGGLDLRLQRLLVEGGDSGAAIVAGDPEESYLYQRMVDGDMPPENIHHRPTAEEIAVIGRWIASGAKTARPEPASADEMPSITEEEREYWAFQPIRRPAVPVVKHAERVRTPIDAFLLVRLEERDLGFSPEAEKRTLIRRISHDLLGLPPTPEQVAEYLADDSPDAYERLIERTLASQHYGERWARHWLDVAGYADSDGHDGSDPIRDDAWGYRDYVIRALNADKPLDEFIREQLAGDEMLSGPIERAGDDPRDVERLLATGFLRTAPDGTRIKDVDRKEAANQVVADTVQIVSSSLLGLTVQCAQCHDHRYDPILQQDYYRLRAILEPAYDPAQWRTSDKRQLRLLPQAEEKQSKRLEAAARKIDKQRNSKEEELHVALVEAAIAAASADRREEIASEREMILKTLGTAAAARRGAGREPGRVARAKLENLLGDITQYDAYKQRQPEIDALTAEAAAVRADKPQPTIVRPLTETPGHVPITFLFHRGDIHSPTDPVKPGDLTILDPLGPSIPERDPERPTTGRRLAYARWLTSGQQPLLPRVLANRVWLHHFGRGIVATPADFGKLGEQPTHPELLDWLAAELVEGGWSLKHLHRVIMTSTVYRQSSQRHPAGEAVDAENTLLWRMPVQRSDAEALRDTMLAVSGGLNPKQFGPPVPLVLDGDGQAVPDVSAEGADPAEAFRRSVYLQVRRTQPLSMMEAFDGPNLDPNCELRNISTAPTQSLFVLNNQFLDQLSVLFAERVERAAGGEPRAQVDLAFQMALARSPRPGELDRSLAFLADQARIYAEPEFTKEVPSPPRQALADLCRSLLAANELMYLE